MKTRINIIITGAGAPGIMGTIFSLKQNGDKHEVFLVGTDINPDVVGMHLCDKFYRIPSPENTEQYLNSLRDICLKEQIVKKRRFQSDG